MALKKDCYKILGIAPRANMEDIRKAYRTLSKKYHPDLNPDLKLYSDEKMKELVEAYGIVSDAEKRREYDSQAQFQIRRTLRGVKGSATTFSSKDTSKAFTKKPEFQKSPSFLERVLSPFLKKEAQTTKTHIDPKQADMHFTLGLTMAENESFYEQAIDEFRLSMKFDPAVSESVYNLGLMYYKTGQFDDAVISFQKVLQIKKEDLHARKMIQLLSEY